MTEYIHYGSPKFSPEAFEPISQLPWWNKPEGGLWASPVEAKFGWKQWNESSRFQKCSDDCAFRFHLNQNAIVIHIKSIDDLKVLAQKGHAYKTNGRFFFEFKKMMKRGVDAIELHLSDDQPCTFEDSLYWALYGWDCDSIIVLNPAVIIPI